MKKCTIFEEQKGARYIWRNIYFGDRTQSLIIHKMLIFPGTLNLSRFRENWDIVVTNEFHWVELKKFNFLNFQLPYFQVTSK